jgi:hypothetical protein
MSEETQTEMMVTVVSSDKVKFTLPRSAAKGSVVISVALGIDGNGDGDDDDDDDDEDEEPSADEVKEVVIDRVMSSTLEKVVEFLKYYPENPMSPIDYVGDS